MLSGYVVSYLAEEFSQLQERFVNLPVNVIKARDWEAVQFNGENCKKPDGVGR